MHCGAAAAAEPCSSGSRWRMCNGYWLTAASCWCSRYCVPTCRSFPAGCLTACSAAATRRKSAAALPGALRHCQLAKAECCGSWRHPGWSPRSALSFPNLSPPVSTCPQLPLLAVPDATVQLGAARSRHPMRSSHPLLLVSVVVLVMVVVTVLSLQQGYAWLQGLLMAARSLPDSMHAQEPGGCASLPRLLMGMSAVGVQTYRQCTWRSSTPHVTSMAGLSFLCCCCR
jgi:hypothetical protein